MINTQIIYTYSKTLLPFIWWWLEKNIIERKNNISLYNIKNNNYDEKNLLHIRYIK